MEWKSKPRPGKVGLLWCIYRRVCKERYDDTCIIHLTK